MEKDVKKQRILLGILFVLGRRIRGGVTNIPGWSHLEETDPLLYRL